MPNNCNIPNCTEKTIYTVPQNEKNQGQLIEAVSDAYNNLVLSAIVALCDIKNETDKIN